MPLLAYGSATPGNESTGGDHSVLRVWGNCTFFSRADFYNNYLPRGVREKMMAVRSLNGFYKLGARAFSTSFARKAKQNFQFVVVGGGSGGMAISSTLCRKYPHSTAIIEPSEVRFLLTLFYCTFLFDFNTPTNATAETCSLACTLWKDSFFYLPVLVLFRIES